MSPAPRYPANASAKRKQLCSRINAERVVARLFDTSGRNIAIVRTHNPLQPFPVIPSAELAGEHVELEMVS